MNTPFWLVWNPVGTNPKFRHASEIQATTEAKRLAKDCPGQNFYVLEGKSVHMGATTVVSNTIELNLFQDEEEV